MVPADSQTAVTHNKDDGGLLTDGAYEGNEWEVVDECEDFRKLHRSWRKTDRCATPGLGGGVDRNQP